jgi:hypothetical protein
MPDYLTDLEIWKAIWPLVLFPLGCALAICLALGSKGRVACVPTVFALSLLGIVIGLLTGLSRESAIGAVLPAVLGLLGGVMIYLIGTKGASLQATVVMGAIGLTLNLLVGAYWGAHSRALYEASVSAPEALAARAVAKENARYTAALQRLLNDQKYAKLKAELDAQASR